MAKKRLIFTLLYQQGYFFLSRNYRLQRVGDQSWLQNNYKFSSIATAIDELVIVDVSRKESDRNAFCAVASEVSAKCFMPLVLGGRIRTMEDAETLIRNGADKLILNTALTDNPTLVRELVQVYGSQCIIASIDYRIEGSDFVVYTHQGKKRSSRTFDCFVEDVCQLQVGELYINSIDQDGTAQGYCLDSLNQLKAKINLPIILAGGAGNQHHLLQALQCQKVDAVATANLFNFIGDGLPNARKHLISKGIDMAQW